MRRRLTIPAPTGVSPSAPRRPPRFPVAFALAVLAVLATVAPEPAPAQTVTTFISNTGQTTNYGSASVRATAFTTGTGTYTLSSVGIVVATQAGSPTPAVKIYGDSGGNPGTLLATMTNPGTITEGAVNVFTAPANTTLSASTTYWVVTSNSAATDGQGFTVGLTDRTLDTGTAPGWSLGNASLKDDIAATSWTASRFPLRFEIRGTSGTTTNNPPAFSADTAARSVAENTAAGQNVGAALTATDADSDTLTYTLEGTDAASFDIVSGSGQIRTRTGVTYNHEAKSTHTVVVKADDGNGGTDTVTVTITVTDVDEPPGRPAAPTVSATAGSTTSLDVTWTAPTNTGPAIASYDLQYRAGTSGNFTNGPQNVTGTSAAIGSLAADTSYEVQVRATNAEGDGDWSVAGTGRTTGTTAPGAPTGLTATASGASQIDLSWSAPASTGGSAITGYKIEVSPNGTSGWTDQVADTNSTATTYAHTGLAAGDTRHYRVSAINANGAGTASNVDSATTGTTAPGAPTGLTATASGASQIDLSWSAPASTGGSAITGYKIEVSPNGTSGWTDQVADTNSTATTYAHTGARRRRHPPLPRLRHQRQRRRHRLQRRQRHHRHHRPRRPDRPHGHGQRGQPDRPLLERPRRAPAAPPSPATRSRSRPTAPPAGPTRSPTPTAPPPPTPTPGSPPATPATTASPPSTPTAPAPPPTSTAPPPAPPPPAPRPASRPRPAGPARSTSPGAPRRAPAAPPSPATRSRSRPTAPPAGPTRSPTPTAPPPPTPTPGSPPATPATTASPPSTPTAPAPPPTSTAPPRARRRSRSEPPRTPPRRAAPRRRWRCS